MAYQSVTAPKWLTEPEQRAWRAYLDMNSRLTARLNRELQDEFGLSIADFSVLVQLSEHVEARMRVLELARALGWEKSRLSHQLSRMQQRGLVARSNCSEDRRGAFIVLTDRGRAAIEQAAPRHVEAVRQYLFDALTDTQVQTLEAIADTVVARLDAAGPADVEPCDSDSDSDTDTGRGAASDAGGGPSAHVGCR